ncbi:MAG: FtsQ-type POTRA domain-containing protein [Parcubacteria group bacterium]|jgi:cell division septal protein FtsQ
MARKIQLKSNKPKRRGFIKFLFYLLLISFLGVVVYLLFFSRYLAVTNISVNGPENIKEEDIKNEIQWEIQGKFGRILEKNNLLLIKTSYYEKDLAEKFKKIDTVEVRRKFPSGLIVNIAEKKLKMIFCAREKCFILDNKGNAFEEIDENSEEYNASSLPVLKDTSNPEVSPGEQMLDPSYIAFSESVKNKLVQELDINLEREYSTPNRISGDLRVVTREGWSIFLNADVDAQKETDMLKAVLDEKIPRDQRGNLEYIDLRSDNKVFYKFKDGSPEEVKPEEEKTAEEQPKVEEKKKKKNH